MPEWKFLRDQNVLDLLQVVWDQHSTNIFSVINLLKAVPKLEARSLDGEVRALNSLAVPTLEPNCRCPHLDFADLPEQHHRSGT